MKNIKNQIDWFGYTIKIDNCVCEHLDFSLIAN